MCDEEREERLRERESRGEKERMVLGEGQRDEARLEGGGEPTKGLTGACRGWAERKVLERERGREGEREIR